MSNRFSYVRYDEKAVDLQQTFRSLVETLERVAEENLPDSRPKSLFLTSLEEAYMWLGKAVRDDQIERTATVDEQPERCND